MTNKGVEVLLSKANKRWNYAYAKLYCSRVLLSLSKNTKPTITYLKLPNPSPLETASQNYTSFEIDKTSLHDLVKDKKIDQLHQLGGVNSLVTALKTDADAGITGTEEDIDGRKQAFGSNYEKPPTKSFFHFFVEDFKHLSILLVLVIAALSLGFGINEQGLANGWYEGGSIFIAVFLVTTVSAVSNYRQNRELDEWSEDCKIYKTEVIRKGRRQQVSIFDVVVGDVICLKIGDQVPADGLFLQGHSLTVDESSMKEEDDHDHVEINSTKNPFLFSGTKVVDGYATILATSVGMNTAWGKMMSEINNDSREETPLQNRLSRLTSLTRIFGSVVALLVLVVFLVSYFTGNTTDEDGNREFNGSRTGWGEIARTVIQSLVDVVSFAADAAPEGLSSAVTVTLAYSMKRMMSDQAMVRKLSACETMGTADVICTDKTGALTLNQMEVTKFWLGKELVGEYVASAVSPGVVGMIQQGVAFNTTGSVYKGNSGAKYEFSGSPTEKAILSWAVEKLKMNMEEVKQSCSVLKFDAFNSEKKRSGVLMRKKLDNTVHVHWKGAAEMVLASCSSYYDASGTKKDLDDREREKFTQIIQGMAASGLRCIGFAHKQVSENELLGMDDKRELDENDLSLIGLVGIKNLCRPGAKRAVQDFQRAGVKIKMITGDNVFTAKAIATECGILRPDEDMSSGVVVEGEEFRNYTDEEKMEKVEKICVMARSSPSDKLLIVQCLKQKGLVVAVTGDGTNYAHVLEKADIGLSMGIQGTEVDKESSDVVILDDNFCTVAKVLAWGRCVNTNVQKFTQFQLTKQVAAFGFNLFMAFSAGEVPLSIAQLLWVSLITDTLGALALATDKPTKELMDKPSVGRTEPLITNIMLRNILAQAMYQIAVLLTLQFGGESIIGFTEEEVHNTLIFNTFVLCQVFNEFTARKLEKKNVFEGILENKLFLPIIGITIVLQVVMVELLSKFASTEKLNWRQWGVCIAFAAASWPIDWVVKCIPVSKTPFLSCLESKTWAKIPDLNFHRIGILFRFLHKITLSPV